MESEARKRAVLLGTVVDAAAETKRMLALLCPSSEEGGEADARTGALRLKCAKQASLRAG